MQDGAPELLHLGDLFSLATWFDRQCWTEQSILAVEDRMLISEVPPTETQEWCLARIAEHRDHIRRLREVYGPTARNPILKTKAHIRALRSEYTAYAPINQHLPPEVLIEVFSNIHPAVVSRGHVPVLHVCRYWRMIIFKTPQFWANLLSLPLLRSMNPRWCVGRFTAALSLSMPRSLILSLPFWSLDVVDLLTPHASRLASLTIHLTLSRIELAKRLLEQHMPRLRELVIPNCSQYWEDPPLTLSFHRYPNIRSLQLGLRLYCALVAPCASLRHLGLTHCTMQAWLTSGYPPTLYSGYSVLELFPNLETLTLIHSLSEVDSFEDSQKLTKTVHLPLLRRLQIEDTASYFPHFLAHVVFPPTTALILELNHDFTFGDPLLIPVIPGINLSPTPDAEISIHLDFLHCVDMSLGHGPEGLARWEVHGAGARPVHVTLIGAAWYLEPIVHFTRELTHALALPPGRGVTALTARGTWAPSSGDRHVLDAREDWTAFLPDIAGLRRLTCAGFGATKDFIDVLGRPLPRSGEFPCPHLAELALVWHLSQAACECFDSELERDGLRQAHGDVEVDAGEEPSPEDAGDGVGYRGEVHLYPAVIASLGELRDTLGACLAERTEFCEPIQKLSVALHGWYGEDLHMQRWQTALVERQLRDGLGHLVGELEVAITRLIERHS